MQQQVITFRCRTADSQIARFFIQRNVELYSTKVSQIKKNIEKLSLVPKKRSKKNSPRGEPDNPRLPPKRWSCKLYVGQSGSGESGRMGTVAIQILN